MMKLSRNEIGRLYDLVTGELEDIQKHNAEGQYDEDVSELEYIQGQLAEEHVKMLHMLNS
jgi:hypothetical protein